MTSCKFCNKFSHTSRWLPVEASDIILYETPNFIVTPTVGSLVAGWVLIISKSHFVSVGHMSQSYLEELRALTELVKGRLQNCQNEVFVFEHGPCSPSQNVGCGIDHLHVHVVPLNFNLLKKSEEYSSFEWRKAKSGSAKDYYINQLPYLYIECPTGEKYITTDATIPSQFFRRVIAKELGIEPFFDWKQNYGIENLEKTVSFFSDKLEFA